MPKKKEELSEEEAATLRKILNLLREKERMKNKKTGEKEGKKDVKEQSNEQSRPEKQDDKVQGNRVGRQRVTYGVLLVEIGVIITVETYALASDGGLDGYYLISFGPIIYGVYNILRGIWEITIEK
jgi:hypothetical protein